MGLGHRGAVGFGIDGAGVDRIDQDAVVEHLLRQLGDQAGDGALGHRIRGEVARPLQAAARGDLDDCVPSDSFADSIEHPRGKGKGCSGRRKG